MNTNGTFVRLVKASSAADTRKFLIENTKCLAQAQFGFAPDDMLVGMLDIDDPHKQFLLNKDCGRIVRAVDKRSCEDVPLIILYNTLLSGVVAPLEHENAERILWGMVFNALRKWIVEKESVPVNRLIPASRLPEFGYDHARAEMVNRFLDSDRSARDLRISLDAVFISLYLTDMIIACWRQGIPLPEHRIRAILFGLWSNTFVTFFPTLADVPASPVIG